MKDYLRYYSAVVVLAIAYAGFLLGGDWLWLGIATFPGLALLDSLFPRDFSVRHMNSAAWAAVRVWICTLGPVILYVLFAWRIAQGGLSSAQILGGVLSCGWMSVVPLIPAAHELYHMRHWFPRTVGHYGHLCILDCTRDIGHVVGHHIDVCTPKDGDTAPRGASLYSFTPRAVVESTLYAYNKEADALRKKGLHPLHYRHRMWRAIAAQLLFQCLLFAIGGWRAVVFALCAMLLARFWVETFNYFQHYGLIRVEGAPIGRRHVWNHLNPLSRIVAFEITNHADHHQNSYLPYYKLQPHRPAIWMPSVFVCFLAALIPPLWQNLIAKPALRKWDLEWATPQERELARAQNRAAGWEDWLAQGPVATPAQAGAPATLGI